MCSVVNFRVATNLQYSQSRLIHESSCCCEFPHPCLSNSRMDNNESPPPRDLFRETPVRYLGYTNELGEAFRPLISKVFVNFSYLVASAYVFADTFTKAKRIYEVSGLLIYSESSTSSGI